MQIQAASIKKKVLIEHGFSRAKIRSVNAGFSR
jgi:hypothetical protein